MKVDNAFLLICFLAIAACASAGDKPKWEAKSAAASLSQSQRLLTHARKLQAEQGCARAIPSYRVISSFGAGYAVAQFELGACLLIIDSASTIETALFHEEAVFWLKRAAWAGNARAQGKLAEILSGAPGSRVAGVKSAPESAMGWAVIYQKNSARDLYNLPSVSPETLNYLHTTLSGEQKDNASIFANNFEKIMMASFTPPAQTRQPVKSRREQPSGGRQKRRR